MGQHLSDITASDIDDFCVKLATVLHTEYDPLMPFSVWLDWSQMRTYLATGIVQSATSVIFYLATYSSGYPSYLVLVSNGIVYKNTL